MCKTGDLRLIFVQKMALRAKNGNKWPQKPKTDDIQIIL